MDFLLNMSENSRIITVILITLLIADGIYFEEKYDISNYLFLIATVIRVQGREEEIAQIKRQEIRDKELEQQVNYLTKELELLRSQVYKVDNN
jgi:hypothetical protein